MFLKHYFSQGGVVTDFTVKRELKKGDARIYSGEKEIGKIKTEGGNFRLVTHEGPEWLLTNRVHGESRPFSFAVYKTMENGNDKSRDIGPSGEEVFVVRDQLFKHNGKFYMLANHPKGKHWNEHVHGAVKYIGRLDALPQAELSQIDFQHRDLRHKIKRLRGTPVGEASGLGMDEEGHRVHLDDELAEVGLFIAAISYLLYASA